MSPRALCIAIGLLLVTPAPVAADPQQPAALRGVRVEERLGARLPLELELIEASGARVRLGDVLGNGKPALLVLAYNRCAMLCSLVLRSVSDFVRESEWRLGERYSVVTLGINPRERPDEARRTQATVLARAGYAERREHWPFLLGTQSAIDRVAESVGFRYTYDERTEQYAHPAVVFAIDPTGRVARYFYGLSLDPAEVQAALAGDARAETASSLTEAVLSCFRFDSMSRLYGGAIQQSFRLGALGVLLAVGSLLVVLHTRRRRAP